MSFADEVVFMCPVNRAGIMGGTEGGDDGACLGFDEGKGHDSDQEA